MVLPALIRWPDASLNFSAPSLNNTIISTTAAVIVGYVVLRKLATVPGLGTISYILPVFSVTYGASAALLLMTRQDYSRFHLIASFIVAVVFFYIAF